MRNNRANHGIILILGFALGGLAVGQQPWPVFWLLPLSLYGVVTLSVPGLRRNFVWLSVGQSPRRVLILAGIIIVASPVTLVVFQELSHTDLKPLVELLPIDRFGSFVLFAIVFSLLNAALEELVFRGILFDALVAAHGIPVAIGVTSLLFGLGHSVGYPPGTVGMVLASLYALSLGLLRAWSKGLMWPIVAHVVADATIMALLGASEHVDV